MIKIDRTRVVKPKCLTDFDSEYMQELKFMIDVFENDKKVENLEFKVYKKDAVKKALKELFYFKCAYCESQVSHVSYFNIDHWRPKGSVKDVNRHEGYYWLGAEWTNLFLSCHVCNTSYKSTQFPILPESKYTFNSSQNCYEVESPLLLNPCIDTPEEHITYANKGAISIKLVNGVVSQKGSVSIEVYGLARSELTTRRCTVQNDVIRSLKSISISIKSSVKILDLGGTALDTVDNLKSIDAEFEKLTNMLNEKSEYLGLVRHEVRKYLKNEATGYLIEQFSKKVEDFDI